jgi:ubiquinone/menaquinone biosynthesis C-methylase UbiE
MSEATTSGGTARTPADIYEERFVPALFGPWGPRVCQVADIQTGHSVLDVACGTGALTLAAASRVGERGRVVGLDVNPQMLDVARRKSSTVDWCEGRAESLPFADASFDRVVSQFGFMFFDDHAQALREMLRVLVPGGRAVVAVCDGLDHSPGYAVLTELLHRLFGAEVAEAFRAPFSLGDRARLGAIARQVRSTAEIRRVDGTVRFDSIESLVATERACAWTLGGLLDDEQFARLRAEADESLRPFLGDDGAIEFDMPALYVVLGPGSTSS